MKVDKNPLGKYPSKSDVEDAIRVSLSVARDQGISVALIGGIAMQFYGSDRLTKDVDFVASGIPGRDARLKRGTSLTFGGGVFSTRRGVPVDFLFRDDGYKDLYEEALYEAKKIGGLPVVSLPYLVAMKLSTRREKDNLDLMFLLSRMSASDIAEARRVIYRLLGGQFAAEDFDAAVDEARWLTRKKPQ